MNKLIEKKYITPEEIANNIDYFCWSMTAIGNFDVGALTKTMVHFSLYCKMLKNCGTEIH